MENKQEMEQKQELELDQMDKVSGGGGAMGMQCPWCGKLFGMYSFSNHLKDCPRRPSEDTNQP